MLRISNLTIKYGPIPVVRDVSFEIRSGEIVALVGSNGAGKTSVAKAIVGLVSPFQGQIELISNRESKYLNGKPAWDIAQRGIIYVPEAKPVFESLSVEENLKLAFASLAIRRTLRTQELEQIYEAFPLLQKRSAQRAGTLSGGQKRVLAIARALLLLNCLKIHKENVGQFSLLILDEPTHGLHPSNIAVVENLLCKLNQLSISVLIIEQMATFALRLSSRAYLMRQGAIVASGDSNSLLHADDLTDLYLGSSTK